MIDRATLETALRDGVAEWRMETDPETVEAYAATAEDLETALRAESDPDDAAADRFAVAEGLYTFASRYHRGQACPLYSVLGTLGDDPIRYSPGCGFDMAPDARSVFDLCRGIMRGDGFGAAADFAERAAVVLAVACQTADDDATATLRAALADDDGDDDGEGGDA